MPKWDAYLNEEDNEDFEPIKTSKPKRNQNLNNHKDNRREQRKHKMQHRDSKEG